MSETIQEQRRDLELVVRRVLACPRCNGTGTLSGEPRSSAADDNCGLCHGSGLFADEIAVSRLVEALAGEEPDDDPMNLLNRPT
jgi:DnaJ-class molecular chaperone